MIVIAFVLAEIAGFALVGRAIGVLATLGLVLFGMLVGTVLIRRLSLQALRGLRADLAAGRAPSRPLGDDVALGVGAILILVPGFLSDLFGMALCVPAVRRVLWRSIMRRFGQMPAQRGTVQGKPARVVDLDRSEYGAASGPRHQDSPWRREEGSGP